MLQIAVFCDMPPWSSVDINISQDIPVTSIYSVGLSEKSVHFTRLYVVTSQKSDLRSHSQ